MTDKTSVECKIPKNISVEVTPLEQDGKVVGNSISLTGAKGVAYLAENNSGIPLTNAFDGKTSSVIMGENQGTSAMLGNPNKGINPVDVKDAAKHHAGVLKKLGVECRGEEGVIERPSVEDLSQAIKAR